MNAYKFLRQGAKSAFSDFVWPTPSNGSLGAWVNATLPLKPCSSGVHVCGPHDLAYWITDELWEVEIDGARIPGVQSVVAERARLIRPVEAWSKDAPPKFISVCQDHARELSESATREGKARAAKYLQDLPSFESPSTVAYIAAIAISLLTSPDKTSAAFHQERIWQGQWITNELQLVHTL